MRIHFDKLKTVPCWSNSARYGHLPHIWYSDATFMRYFCRGW